MACLLNIPNEIINEILGHIELIDLESVIMSCKKFYSAGSKRLKEHQDIKTNFRRVLQASQGSYQASEIARILHRIWIEPDEAKIRIFDLPASLPLMTVFAGLASLTSLKVKGYVQMTLSPDDVQFILNPCSSNIQNLILEECVLPDLVLFNLIKSTMSLRRFSYSWLGSDHNRPLSGFLWVRAAIVAHASTSLKELTLRRGLSMPASHDPFTFKSCYNLLVLNIDFELLMGKEHRTTTKMVKFLPTSLKVLNLYGCTVGSIGWLLDLVKSVVKSKERELLCLKEMNFKESLFKWSRDALQVGQVCEVAGRAGIEMAITSN